jgi:hypothetical protein
MNTLFALTPTKDAERMTRTMTSTARMAALLAIPALTVVAFALPLRAQTLPPQTGPQIAEQAPIVEAAPVLDASRPEHETTCNDRRDEDGDGMVDCADADCFHNAACESGQGLENTNASCSDWIDNDGDDAIDCDDDDCSGPGVTVCRGSAQGAGAANSGPAQAGIDDEIPELGEGMTVEDLIGTSGDIDGERSDEVCADGIDNDGDGRTDCADFGCRFDPQVTVCSNAPGIRFSAVVGVGLTFQSDTLSDTATAGGLPTPPDVWDARFSRIQLRALGPIPFIQNSFFLINLRAERTPRLTFAMFQIPLGSSGHYLNINSGGGSLSSALITSASKQLLLDPPYYVYSAFEQGNGAAVEVGGPIGDGTINYRAFAAGGSGNSTGNVGGSYFTTTDRNFTYTVGAAATFNLIGSYNRFDSPFLYTPAPLTMAIVAGVKWDQRAVERYFAWNAFFALRYSRFVFTLEHYGKLSFASPNVGAGATGDNGMDAWAPSFVAQLGVLAIPKLLLFSADFGGFYPQDPSCATSAAGCSYSSSTIKRPLAEMQWRLGAHLYWYKNIALASFVYTNRTIQTNDDNPSAPTNEQSGRFELQFRF